MLPNSNLRVVAEPLLVVVLFLLAIVSPALFILLGLYLVYRFMHIIQSPEVGWITKFLLSVLLIFSINTIIGLVAWLLKIRLSLDVMAVVYAVSAFILLLINRRPGLLKTSMAQKREVFALILALILFWVTLSPLSPRHDAILATRVITSGGDNISHLEFLRTIDANSGYVQANYLDLKDTLSAKLVPYPQGWHLNIVLLKKTIEAIKGSPLGLDNTLYLYHIVSGAGLAVLAYFFLVLGLGLRSLNNHSSQVFTYLSVATLAALLFLGPFFAFFAIGFQTQIFALGLFLAQLQLLFMAVAAKDKRQKQLLICLALLLAGGIAYTWFFLWPVALAAIGLFLIEILKLNSKRAVLAEAKFLVFTILFTAAGIGQLYFLMAFAPKSSTLIEPGFILEPNNILLINLLLAVFVFVYYAYNHLQVRLLGQIAAIAAIFALSVLIAQLIQVAEPRYFYYKSTYTFILLAALILSVALAAILSHIADALSKTRPQVPLLVIALVLAFASISWTTSSKYLRLYVEQKPYGLSDELSDAVLTIVKTNPDDGHRVVALGSCNREYDIVAMRLATALGGSPKFGQQDVIEAQIKSPKRSVTFRAVKKYLREESQLIMLSTDYQIQEDLKTYLGNDAAKLRFVDLDVARSPKTPQDCPHYLR